MQRQLFDMPSAPIIRRKRERWRRVQAAQDYIAGQSHKIAKSLVRSAIKGDAVTGRWLLEHVAIVGPEGNELRPLSRSIDTQAIATQAGEGNAPRILIGVSLGSDFAQLATSQAPRQLAPIAIPPSQSVSPIEPIPQIIDVSASVPVLATHDRD